MTIPDDRLKELAERYSNMASIQAYRATFRVLLEKALTELRDEMEKEPKCPINPTANGYNYTVYYGGGDGPDVWDAEKNVFAVDIRDALAQCGEIVDEGDWIFSIQQNDYPEPTGDRLRAKLAAAEQRIEQAEKIEEGLTNTLSAEAEHIEKQEVRIAQLEAQLKSAWGALEPFDISGEDDEDFGDETPVVVKFGRTTCYSMRLKHLRNVAKALAELSRLEQEGGK
jgi:hypothetical protein